MGNRFARLVRIVRDVVRDRGGNTLMIFGIALIPLMASVGAAVDYSQAARANSRMQQAANAASLAGARVAQNYMNSTNSSAANFLIAQAMGLTEMGQVFTANQGTDTTISTVTPTFTLTQASDGTAVANADAAASMPTAFMKLVGVSTVPLSVHSQAQGSRPSYYQIVFVVDVSNSMGIGGDSATIAAMQSNKYMYVYPESKYCAFACHDPSSYEGTKKSTYCYFNGSDKNCTGYSYGWYSVPANPYYCPATSQVANPIDCVPFDDKRTLAKYQNFSLKIDAVNSAIQTFLSNLQPYMVKAPKQFQVSIWTFGSSWSNKQIFPTSSTADPVANNATYLTQLNSAASSIDLEAANDWNGSDTVNHNHGYTLTTTGLTGAYSGTSNIGDGSDATHRKTYFIILTDGAEDIPGSVYANRQVVVNYKTQCDKMKALASSNTANSGAQIFSIEATYPPVPGDTQYNTLIGNTGMAANITSAMQYCASTGGYFAANNNADIQTAVNQVFSNIIGGNLRITQ